jgi:hypothetical protein
VLQKRNPTEIEGCKEYLHFLMKGLEALKPYNPQDVLWRGVSRQVPWDPAFLIYCMPDWDKVLSEVRRTNHSKTAISGEFEARCGRSDSGRSPYVRIEEEMFAGSEKSTTARP